MRIVKTPTATSWLLIIFVGIIVYGNTFNAPFYLDDYNIIYYQPERFRIATLLDDLPAGFFMESRWLGNFSFAVNYAISGQNSTLSYHIVNIAIHILTGLALYCLLCDVISTTAPKIRCLENRPIALFAALAFVSHPLMTQGVTYIVQRLSTGCP